VSPPTQLHVRKVSSTTNNLVVSSHSIGAAVGNEQAGMSQVAGQMELMRRLSSVNSPHRRFGRSATHSQSRRLSLLKNVSSLSVHGSDSTGGDTGKDAGASTGAPGSGHMKPQLSGQRVSTSTPSSVCWLHSLGRLDIDEQLRVRPRTWNIPLMSTQVPVGAGVGLFVGGTGDGVGPGVGLGVGTGVGFFVGERVGSSVLSAQGKLQVLGQSTSISLPSSVWKLHLFKRFATQEQSRVLSFLVNVFVESKHSRVGAAVVGCGVGGAVVGRGVGRGVGLGVGGRVGRGVGLAVGEIVGDGVGSRVK
jgi:hypothetical protein